MKLLEGLFYVLTGLTAIAFIVTLIGILWTIVLK